MSSCEDVTQVSGASPFSSSEDALKWQFVDQFVSESGVGLPLCSAGVFRLCVSFCRLFISAVPGEEEQHRWTGIDWWEGDQGEEGLPQPGGGKGDGHQHLQRPHPETRDLHQQREAGLPLG